MELIIGAAVSLFVQAVKAKFGGGMWTLAILVMSSIMAAALYTLAVSVGLWETVANVLLVAGAFYAFVIQRFEGAKPLFEADEVER